MTWADRDRFRLLATRKCGKDVRNPRGHVVFSIAQATDACHLLFTMIPHLHPDVRIKVFALIRDKVQTSTAGVVGCQDVEDKLLVTVGNKELSDSFTIAPSLAAD